MTDQPVGSLGIQLGITGNFLDDVEGAREGFAGFVHAVQDQLVSLNRTVRNVAIGMTAAFTVPFVALVHTSRQVAGSFETAMGQVHAALRQSITPEQLQQLSLLARRLGPDMGKSATEAASAFAELGRSGLTATQILRGAGDATVRLAAANAADLEPAAHAVTDAMQQFGLVTADLPRIVNLITGALDASKLGFEDFQLAMSQAGGVAGSAGVSFEDFNTALAGTATLFGSGSDAGTSFKTFIQRLVPQSEDARRVMERLGLQFYDAQGRMKSMADIAGELRTALQGLSEQSRNQALTMMFGSDAMRTAIGLIGLGKEGFEDLQRTIGQTDAADKLAIQLTGLEAASHRLSAAFEGLKIALGEAGLLALFTGLATATTALVNSIATLPQPLLTAGLAVGALVAAIGPLTLAIMGLVRLALPLLIGRLGLVGLGFAALINPVGVMAVLFVRLAVALTGATSALSLFATGLARVLGPIGLLLTALTILYFMLNQQAVASAAVTAASDALTAATGNYEEAALAAAAATGEARRQALANARAKREEAAAVLQTARANLAEAQSHLANLLALSALNRERMRVAAQDPRIAAGAGPHVTQDAIEQEQANIATLTATMAAGQAAIERADRVIAAATLAPAGTQNVNFDRANRERQSRHNEEDLAQRREELRLQQMIDVAQSRGDLEAERSAQRTLDLVRREDAYRSAGLNRAQATVAAARDMADLQAARTEGLAVEADLEERRMDLEEARIRQDNVLVRQRENELFLAERIHYWRTQEMPLVEAQIKANAELAHLEQSREDARARAVQNAAAERQLQLSQLRGDSEGQIRSRQRAVDQSRRTREIMDREGINEDQAGDRAGRELDEEEQARLQGQFRQTFRDGIRAALDGSFSGWFENWWKDRLTRSLEDALNNIADLLSQLFRNAAQGVGGGEKGGGIFGAILSGLGGLIGGPGGGGGDLAMLDKMAPGAFATGGSFEVGGKAGPDMNLVSMRLTKGEMVNIRRPGDRGGSEEEFVRVSISLDDDMLEARVVSTSAGVVAELSPGIEARAEKRTLDGIKRPRLA